MAGMNEFAALLQALRAVIAQGLVLSNDVEKLVSADSSQSRDPARRLADLLASTEGGITADKRAAAAAKAAGYASGTRRGRAGRQLDGDALYDTGVAGWLVADANLRSGEDEVIDGLAHYLAGPHEPIWRYLGIDADLHLLDGPIDVAGWELVVMDKAELVAISPLPGTSTYVPRPTWDPQTRWAR